MDTEVPIPDEIIRNAGKDGPDMEEIIPNADKNLPDEENHQLPCRGYQYLKKMQIKNEAFSSIPLSNHYP
jgi:hypothetical protein